MGRVASPDESPGCHHSCRGQKCEDPRPRMTPRCRQPSHASGQGRPEPGLGDRSIQTSPALESKFPCLFMSRHGRRLPTHSSTEMPGLCRVRSAPPLPDRVSSLLGSSADFTLLARASEERNGNSSRSRWLRRAGGWGTSLRKALSKF